MIINSYDLITSQTRFEMKSKNASQPHIVNCEITNKIKYDATNTDFELNFINTIMKRLAAST